MPFKLVSINLFVIQKLFMIFYLAQAFRTKCVCYFKYFAAWDIFVGLENTVCKMIAPYGIVSNTFTVVYSGGIQRGL
jgi:hypothetical protein